MARRLNNRNSDEIVAFLLAHEFYLTNTHGDDDIYCKKGWHLTCKVTRNRKSTPIGTMAQIKRCSGYSTTEWCQWWKENGFGE